MEKCVLDTSALMSCCNIIERLKSEYNIIIPITVMEVSMVMAMARIMKMRRKGM